LIARKQLDLPPAVARSFVKDMMTFFAEENRYKQDELAFRQFDVLKEHRGAAGKGASIVRREGDVSADEAFGRRPMKA